jgi:polyferredoxin
MEARSGGKKVLKRRRGDSSQNIRSAFQIGFLLLNLWIGLQFYLWVRYYETGGRGFAVNRPPGVEGWLPIASLMNLKAWISGGGLTEIHAAGVFLLIAFLTISFVARKSFCGWLCPIGTISEALWQAAERVFAKTLRPPKWLDWPLRGLKYLLLAFFVHAILLMPVAAIRAFLDGPYGIVADVKMLNFFRQISLVAVIVTLVLILLSMVVRNFWCRYLCPYGALMGLAALPSPVGIRRDPALCVDCGKCTEACPSLLPVARLTTVRSPECTACFACVSACPAAEALELRSGRGRRVPAWKVGFTIAAIFLGIVGVARLNDRWHTRLPESVYFELVPRANQFPHPR